MKFRIFLGVVISVLAMVIGFVVYRLSPSGDINRYRQYFIQQKPWSPGHGLQVTFFGVSTLLFDDGETQVIIDGFFSRPSVFKTLFSEIRSDTALIDHIIGTYDRHRVKGVFVTHTHYDHAFDAGYVTRKTGAILYGSKSALNVGRGAGLTDAQLKLFEPGKDIEFGKFSVRVFFSQHSPGNGLKDDGVEIEQPLFQPASFKSYSEGGSYDFLITHAGKRIYIKPSPNFIPGALDSLDVDAVFLGIPTITNQGEQWTDSFYRENVLALDPSLVVPLHWDDFFKPLSENLVMMPKLGVHAGRDFDWFVNRIKQDKIEFGILPSPEASYFLNKANL